MKRNKRPASRQPKRKLEPLPKVEKRRKLSRREVMGLAKFYLGAASILGVGGWYFAGKVMAGIDEADLSKIGNGTPAIVQIHDPQCSSCRALQRQTRLALEEFSDGSFEYLVANIATPEGRDFADRHGVGHVTLLLMDGRGRVRNVIQGQRSREALVPVFKAHKEVSNISGS